MKKHFLGFGKLFNVLQSLIGQMASRPMRNIETFPSRVAGLGRLSAGAKMAMKPFVKRVFTIFATNASFLRVISNFRI